MVGNWGNILSGVTQLVQLKDSFVENMTVNRKRTDVGRLANSSWSLKSGYHPHTQQYIINPHPSFARTHASHVLLVYLLLDILIIHTHSVCLYIGVRPILSWICKDSYQFQIETWTFSCCGSRFLDNAELYLNHLHWTAKKCTKTYNAHAELL